MNGGQGLGSQDATASGCKPCVLGNANVLELVNADVATL